MCHIQKDHMPTKLPLQRGHTEVDTLQMVAALPSQGSIAVRIALLGASVVVLALYSTAQRATNVDPANTAGHGTIDIFGQTWEGNLSVFKRTASPEEAGGESIAAMSATRHEAFLCTTRTFANFELTGYVKTRLPKKVGEANTGIQFRSVRDAKVPLVGGDFNPTFDTGLAPVVGFQADLITWPAKNWMQAGDTVDAFGWLYDEYRRNKWIVGCDSWERKSADWSDNIFMWLKRPRPPKTSDWRAVKLQAHGARVRISIDGVCVTKYEETEFAYPKEGIICLQTESPETDPMEVHYRDVHIQELTEEPPEFRD